ncbi:Histone deacetylase complex subunit SAP30L [Myotis brandtii]|uniref:Histone deacetylase complex subunit SAP30L n=1 Tax=Myotis brandtii TaxID=109478 RepID=S7N0C5_MYOBR|nr:Histone deacetylase complex subunit SAP30L [Myotis brandtii]
MLLKEQGFEVESLTIRFKVRHLYICDFHKNFIQSVRNKRKRKTSDDGGDSPEHDTDIPEVDLFQLQVNTLRRYKRHYKLQTRPGFNKAQLAETVSRHFRNIPVNEKETLAYFIYMVKSNKSRLDQKSEGSKQLENIPVNEKETLAYFIYMVKSNKSRLDQKSEGSKQLE